MDNGKATIIASIIAAIATIIAAIIGVTMQKQNSTLQAENLESRNEISNMQERILQLEETISALKIANGESEDESSSLQEQISDLQAQILTLRDENSRLESENQMLRDNSETHEAISDTNTGELLYLLDVCPPYQMDYKCSINNTVTMAGIQYLDCMIINRATFQSGSVYFNLGGQYDMLSFDIGHIDGEPMNGGGAFNFYLDGKLTKCIEVNPESMPQHYEIQLNKATQMKIEGTNRQEWGGIMPAVGYFALTNLIVS